MSESLYLTQLVVSLKESLNGGKISPENCIQLLSKGMFKPEYYSFFDDDIIYDSKFYI